ncbi:hypothetical protein KY289_019294 [Solanum tuberosum]|nr:hypothetical protein KY289_019294 [Solanum tuberosum]
MGGWDNTDDALQMAILYFIHTFVFSQLDDAPIPIEDFIMVEDDSYQQFSWGQLAFTKLMKSFRKEYKPDKQVYHLNGFSYALNVLVYECASIIHNEIAVKEGNGIPRIGNWKVMGARPKFEMFMENIFTENDCSNVQPTQEEIRSLDLPNNSHVPPTQPATSDVNHEEVQPDEVPGFEEFSSKPLEKLLWRSTQVSTTRSTPPPKRRKVAHPTKNNVPKATQPDEQPNQPFQTPDSHPPQVDNVFGVPHNAIFRRTISDNAGLEELKGHMKSYFCVILIFWIMKDNGGIYMPHIVDDSVNKDNVDPQSASDQFFQQIISPIQMNFATVDHDVDASAVEVEKRHVIEENIANEDAVHEAPQLHTKILSGDEDVADTIQQDFKKHASNSVIVDTSDVASPIKFHQFNAKVPPVDTEGTPQITCKQKINIEANLLYLDLIIWILLSHFLWTRTDFILCHIHINAGLISI